MSASTIMSASLNHPEPFTKLQAGERLSAEEQTMIGAWAFMTFNNMEATYLHSREGLLDPDVYEGRVRSFIWVISRSPYASIMLPMWQTMKVYAFTEGFVSLVDSRLADLTAGVDS